MAPKLQAVGDDGMTPFPEPVEKARRVKILVEGRTSLLTHNPSAMSTPSETKKGKSFPEPDVEAEAGTYRLADGTLAMQGESLVQAIVRAGGQWKVPKKRMSMASLLQHMTSCEDLVPLTRHDGTPIKDYVIDARRAIVQGNGIIRHRPRFDEWRACFTIEYDPVLIPDPRIIIEIAADAGARIGIGDYRPRFGRFRIVGYWLL
jgi:hypothetical protein